MVSVHLSHRGRARPDVKGAVSVRLVLESGTVLVLGKALALGDREVLADPELMPLDCSPPLPRG